MQMRISFQSKNDSEAIKITRQQSQPITYPELVILSWWALLDEGAKIRGNVAVMRKLFQHINLQFNLLFLILKGNKKIMMAVLL